MLRPDQLTMLQDLAERLADVFIVEADPNNWSGAGKLPTDMSREERGDRAWDRKGAMGTGGVLRYTLDIAQAAGHNEIDSPAEQAARDADLDARIIEAQKRAHEALSRVRDKSKGKAEFDRRVLGSSKA